VAIAGNLAKDEQIVALFKEQSKLKMDVSKKT
jgi:hypothetical protein